MRLPGGLVPFDWFACLSFLFLQLNICGKRLGARGARNLIVAMAVAMVVMVAGSLAAVQSSEPCRALSRP
eukprot:SAG22_NODE_14916_length_361_cov_1.530534_1_plen_69_part_10